MPKSCRGANVASEQWYYLLLLFDLPSSKSFLDNNFLMAAIETFASSLLGDNGHEALVKLSDGEIKALEHVKAYLVKQIHITEQFFNSMTKLNSSSVIQKADFDADSPFAQVSEIVICWNISLSNAMFSNIIKKTTHFLYWIHVVYVRWIDSCIFYVHVLNSAAELGKDGRFWPWFPLLQSYNCLSSEDSIHEHVIIKLRDNCCHNVNLIRHDKDRRRLQLDSTAIDL